MIMRIKIVGLLQALAICGLCSIHPGDGADQAVSNCQELGFTGLQLCSDCDRFYEHIQDEELAEDCRKCCTPDQGANTITYKTVTLEVDTNRFRDFPNVEDFLNKYQHGMFKDVLTVQYRWMSPPRLILKAGKERLTIRIDSWKTDNILEFLQEKLGLANKGKTS